MKLHQFKTSGNCYKIRLFLHQLEKKCDHINLSRDGSRLSKEFLLKSPLGKVPVLEINEGNFLTESMSILYFLSQNTKFFPKDISLQTEILKWLSFEQSEIQTSIAKARYFIKFKKEIKTKYIENAKEKLKIIDFHLFGKKFLVGDIYTIADISLYAYVHLAPEIDISLNEYPNIVNWLYHVETQPKYIPMY